MLFNIITPHHPYLTSPSLILPHLTLPSLIHRHRIVKNIGWANQNVGGKVVKSEKCMDVSQLLGGTCLGCPPKVYAYALIYRISHCLLLPFIFDVTVPLLLFLFYLEIVFLPYFIQCNTHYICF